MELLTVSEAATLLRRSPRTIERWMTTNALPSRRVGRGRYIRRADVEALISGAEPGTPTLTPDQMSLIRRAMDDALASLGQ